jgi:flagellar biosynthesis chaperone FliJ
MRRMLSLRAREEERAEVELQNQRQLRQACIHALEASEARKHAALRTLHRALDRGDRVEAISAEMAMACSPRERQLLQRRLAQLERSVGSALTVWHHSRVRRLQIEVLAEAEDARLRNEARVGEQKGLDAWFLSSWTNRCTLHEDENFPRKRNGSREDSGMAHAKKIQE